MKRYNKLSKNPPLIENIPSGYYCYDEDGLCPYYSIKKNKPYQENGYCHFMKKGDWDLPYVSLLWDQCKECSIFTDINELDLVPYTFMEKVNYWWNRIKLWKTIEKKYNFKEKLDIFFLGKIFKCKICKQYFLISPLKNISNSCNVCKTKLTEFRKQRSKGSNE